MKVVGYICSSVGGKTDRSLEIKIQREQIERYCAERNIPISVFYTDMLSESDKERKELKKLISESSHKSFVRVIVSKFDRLGSNKANRAKIYQLLADNSVDLFSVTENRIMMDPHREGLQEKVDLIIRKVKDIPSLPEIVTRVMELVSNPSSSAAELSMVIAHDPGLTSRVLRLVNSAYYGFPKQISSVQQAIMILGFTTMRGLVLSTSIFKIFTPKESSSGKTLDYREFWKHSLSTALCARVVAQAVGITDVGDAFSCGILHDIGKVVLDQYSHSDYVEVFGSLKKSYTSKQLIYAEENIIGVNHADIGYRLADQWNLPLNLSESIRCHHKPMESITNTKIVSVVYMANVLANIIVKPYMIMDVSSFEEDVLDYLGINENKLYRIYDICKEEVEAGGEFDSFFE